MLATFSQGVREVLHEILKVFNTLVGLFSGFVWNNEGIQHAAIFDRFFLRVFNTVLARREGVSERGSLIRRI